MLKYKITFFLVLLSCASVISAYGQENRICPYGSYLGKDTFGNQACLDSKTNEVVGSPNIGQSTSGSGDNGTVIGIVVFIIIIAIITGIAKSRSKPSGYVEREEFSLATKEAVKERQEGRCAKCREYPNHWEFDHIGSRGDNSIENCQGLCLDCHQDKTERERNSKL